MAGVADAHAAGALPFVRDSCALVPRGRLFVCAACSDPVATHQTMLSKHCLVGGGQVARATRPPPTGQCLASIGWWPQSLEIRPRSSEFRPRFSEIRPLTSDIRSRSSEILPRSSEIRARSSEIRARSSEICNPRKSAINRNLKSQEICNPQKSAI